MTAIDKASELFVEAERTVLACGTTRLGLSKRFSDDVSLLKVTKIDNASSRVSFGKFSQTFA